MLSQQDWRREIPVRVQLQAVGNPRGQDTHRPLTGQWGRQRGGDLAPQTPVELPTGAAASERLMKAVEGGGWAVRPWGRPVMGRGPSLGVSLREAVGLRGARGPWPFLSPRRPSWTKCSFLLAERASGGA